MGKHRTKIEEEKLNILYEEYYNPKNINKREKIKKSFANASSVLKLDPKWTEKKIYEYINNKHGREDRKERQAALVPQPNAPLVPQPNAPSVIQPNAPSVIQPNAPSVIQPNAQLVPPPNAPSVIQPNAQLVPPPNVPSVAQPNRQSSQFIMPDINSKNNRKAYIVQPIPTAQPQKQTEDITIDFPSRSSSSSKDISPVFITPTTPSPSINLSIPSSNFSSPNPDISPQPIGQDKTSSIPLNPDYRANANFKPPTVKFNINQIDSESQVKQQKVELLDEIKKCNMKSLELSCIDNKDQRLEGQNTLAYKMNTIVQNMHSYYSKGKNPANCAGLKQIKTKENKMARNFSDTTRSILNRNSESDTEDKEVPSTIKYSLEQKCFLTGICNNRSECINDVEVIASYSKGIIYTKNAGSATTLLKMEVPSKKVTHSVTGLYTHAIAVEAFEEINTVFVMGDRRVFAFSLDTLELKNVYGLDNYYNNAIIRLYKGQLIVYASNYNTCRVFIYELSDQMCTYTMEIDKSIARSEKIDMKNVNNCSGYEYIRVMETKHISNMCVVGDYVVLTYPDQTNAYVFTEEGTNYVSILIGHTEQITNILPFGENTVLTFSDDKTCRKWNITNGENLCCYTEFSSPPSYSCAATVLDISVLFIASSDGKIHCFNENESKIAFVKEQQSGYFTFLNYTDNILFSVQPMNGSSITTHNYQFHELDFSNNK